MLHAFCREKRQMKRVQIFEQWCTEEQKQLNKERNIRANKKAEDLVNQNPAAQAPVLIKQVEDHLKQNYDLKRKRDTSKEPKVQERGQTQPISKASKGMY
eukprot:GHVP01040266.1.p1 GENE.GHVP01040266.1~~GHVP01040266.1.p1  ORF type:complete len:100 (-),score=23.93 GHVP01040266.1:52-351(-)